MTGLDNVTIQPKNSPYQTLGTGNNFTFTCTVNEPNGTATKPNITLTIPGNDSREKLAKVTNETTRAGVEFTYNITEYTDDQTVFICWYTYQNHTWSSPNLTLTVFCECLPTCTVYMYIYLCVHVYWQPIAQLEREGERERERERERGRVGGRERVPFPFLFVCH